MDTIFLDSPVIFIWSTQRWITSEMYYETVRNSQKTDIVRTIPKNTGISEAARSKAYDHVSIDEHELYGGIRRFDSDYDMAESFRRLHEDKDIWEHDLILLRHEHLEQGLMEKLGPPYEEAHRLAERKYNYREALEVF